MKEWGDNSPENKQWCCSLFYSPSVQPARPAAVGFAVWTRRGPTWPVCPPGTCVPTGVCVSAAATRPAATGSKSPPWSRPRRTPARSPGSSSTFRKSTCCCLDDGGQGEEEERVSECAPCEVWRGGATVANRRKFPYAWMLTLSWPLIVKFWASKKEKEKRNEIKSTMSDLFLSGTSIAGLQRLIPARGFPAVGATSLLRWMRKRHRDDSQITSRMCSTSAKHCNLSLLLSSSATVTPKWHFSHDFTSVSPTDPSRGHWKEVGRSSAMGCWPQYFVCYHVGHTGMGHITDAETSETSGQYRSPTLPPCCGRRYCSDRSGGKFQGCGTQLRNGRWLRHHDWWWAGNVPQWRSASKIKYAHWTSAVKSAVLLSFDFWVSANRKNDLRIQRTIMCFSEGGGVLLVSNQLPARIKINTSCVGFNKL